MVLLKRNSVERKAVEKGRLWINLAEKRHGGNVTMEYIGWVSIYA
jgi:hypothetical protein